jgi:hypothetical protein
LALKERKKDHLPGNTGFIRLNRYILLQNVKAEKLELTGGRLVEKY